MGDRGNSRAHRFPKYNVQYDKGERHRGRYAVTDSLTAQFTCTFSSVQFSLCVPHRLWAVLYLVGVLVQLSLKTCLKKTLQPDTEATMRSFKGRPEGDFNPKIAFLLTVVSSGGLTACIKVPLRVHHGSLLR